MKTNPTRCSKSRKTLSLLESKTTDFKIIEFLKNTLNFDDIKIIIYKLAINPIDLIRKNEEIWINNYKGGEMSDSEIIKAMEENPKLIERPIVIKDNQGVIARPPEKVLILFD